MRASRSNSRYPENPSKTPVESKAAVSSTRCTSCAWQLIRSPHRRGLFWHPGCVVGNHEPAVAALLVNLRFDDGKAESLTALVFAFDADDAGRRRRPLIDVDLRCLFRRELQLRPEAEHSVLPVLLDGIPADCRRLVPRVDQDRVGFLSPHVLHFGDVEIRERRMERINSRLDVIAVGSLLGVASSVTR